MLWVKSLPEIAYRLVYSVGLCSPQFSLSAADSVIQRALGLTWGIPRTGAYPLLSLGNPPVLWLPQLIAFGGSAEYRVVGILCGHPVPDFGECSSHLLLPRNRLGFLETPRWDTPGRFHRASHGGLSPPTGSTVAARAGRRSLPTGALLGLQRHGRRTCGTMAAREYPSGFLPW